MAPHGEVHEANIHNKRFAVEGPAETPGSDLEIEKSLRAQPDAAQRRLYVKSPVLKEI